MIVQSCRARRPLRHFSCLITAPHPRFFHSSPSQKDDHGIPNHYETLDIQPNASPVEVKKQFYKLSKSHHPDLHPNDPTAPQRFVKISEAYATLGSPEKRSRYDRDFHRAHSPPSSSGPRPSGSYSSASTTPFGGRPASGLSRRRTQFRGPPPSFYSSGGWGQHSEKRGSAASQASHTHEAQGEAASNNVGGGMGPGGFTHGWDNDVRHFDQRAHTQTHSNIEQTRHKARRRREVRSDDTSPESSGGSVLFNFLWVSGTLVGLLWVLRTWSVPPKTKARREE
ncbi:hypothetical protein BDY17DRAFT_256439 [Neohortaea acidophila]|uniref:J domain-containing protein n=1 Tax=Neohortaea acidophila TaxID=245834 RepID=A0A6A6PKD3_9PEZI|nr:uncharacterized protein BDY17DRAFT_256439 [Neohortaea acidophila]KAF2480124.1 hypothetical protein BDY17DRAFT_256439 [Neohortaea acidophila]